MMAAERDWYGRDWKILRSQLVKLCLLHCHSLLHGVQKGRPLPVSSFMEKITQDINNRITLDKVGLWQHCLPLLIRRKWLEKELEKDRQVLCGEKKSKGKEVTPHQALARKLNLFFEMNRRQNLAEELGVSSNRIKTWERLDRISRKISQTSPGNRCRDEHFNLLASHVKQYHGHDKNLPRKAKTVKGYFYRFSNECLDNIEDRDSTMDKLSLHKAKDLLQGVGMAELGKCLQEMPAIALEIIDVSFGLGISPIHYLSIEDYLHNNRLTLDHFRKQQDQAMAQLRDCLELRLVARQGEHAL